MGTPTCFLGRVLFAKTEIDIWEDFPDLPQNRKEIEAYFENPSLFEKLKSQRTDDFEYKNQDYNSSEKTIWKKFCTFTNKRSRFTRNDILKFLISLSKTVSNITLMRVTYSTLSGKMKILAKVLLGETGVDIWKTYPNLPKKDWEIEGYIDF